MLFREDNLNLYYSWNPNFFAHAEVPSYAPELQTAVTHFNEDRTIIC